jgi:hypothetical protein
MPPVGVVRVGAQQSGHQRRQAPRVGQLQQQVEVVAQQAIVVRAQAEAVAGAQQQGAEAGPVLVVEEDGLAVVAAVQDVVAGGLGPLGVAWLARHGGSSTG